MATIQIKYYSDILCIWAYVSQIRIDELVSEFGDHIELDFRFLPVFGHAREKIDRQWENKGGTQAYNEHVQEVAVEFNHIEVHPDIWMQCPPSSSLPGHLYLCAVRLAEREGKLETGSCSRLAWSLRKAFFTELADISDQSVLRQLVERDGLLLTVIESRIQSGEAYAALSEDMQQARELAVRSSPTLIFNEDRQRLTGNVGYRIIEANIRELLEKPGAGHSWC